MRTLTDEETEREYETLLGRLPELAPHITVERKGASIRHLTVTRGPEFFRVLWDEVGWIIVKHTSPEDIDGEEVTSWVLTTNEVVSYFLHDFDPRK